MFLLSKFVISNIKKKLVNSLRTSAIISAATPSVLTIKNHSDNDDIVTLKIVESKKDNDDDVDVNVNPPLTKLINHKKTNNTDANNVTSTIPDPNNDNFKIVYPNGTTTNLYTKEFCDQHESLCYNTYDSLFEYYSYGGNRFTAAFGKVNTNVSIIGTTTVLKNEPVLTKEESEKSITNGKKIFVQRTCIIPPNTNVYYENFDLSNTGNSNKSEHSLLAEKLFVKNKAGTYFPYETNMNSKEIDGIASIIRNIEEGSIYDYKPHLVTLNNNLLKNKAVQIFNQQ